MTIETQLEALYTQTQILDATVRAELIDVTSDVSSVRSRVTALEIGQGPNTGSGTGGGSGTGSGAAVEIVSSLPTIDNVVGRTVLLDTKLWVYDGDVWVEVQSSATVEDTPPAVLVVSSLPSTGVEGDVVFNTADGYLYRRNNGLWAQVTVQVNTAATVADASLTVSKFASGLRPVEIFDILPTTGNIEGRLVYLTTDNKLHRHDGTSFINSFATSDLTGTITADQIAANAITTGKIQAGAITASQIAAEAVNAGKIAAESITTDKLAANAVTASKIATSAITADKIEANTITAGKIAAGAIGTSQLAANAITATNIAAGAVTAGKIGAAAITANELAAGSVTADKIAAGSVTADKLTTGVLISNSGQIADLTVTNAKIANLTVGTTKISADAVTQAWQGVLNSYTAVNSTLGVEAEYFAAGSGLVMPAAGKLVVTMVTYFHNYSTATSYRVQAVNLVDSASSYSDWPQLAVNAGPSNSVFSPTGPSSSTAGYSASFVSTEELDVVAGQVVPLSIYAIPSTNNSSVFILEANYVAVLYKK